jgi:hypothetical protein
LSTYQTSYGFLFVRFVHASNSLVRKMLARKLLAAVAFAGTAFAVNTVVVEGQQFVDTVTKDRVVVIGVE